MKQTTYEIISGTIEVITEKAILLNLTPDETSPRKVWIPISVLSEDSRDESVLVKNMSGTELEVASWFCKKEELE